MQEQENKKNKCEKCGYYSLTGKDLVSRNNAVLCSICDTFAPEDAIKLDSFIEEKIDWKQLETFRKFGVNKASHSIHKKGMITRAKEGNLMARPPFGYSVSEGKLIPNENAENVRLIFKEFIEGKSLNQLSQTYNLSVNGIKKILKNFTYIGKIKFNNEINSGNHQPIISNDLFNEVQKKFESNSK